MNKRFISLVVVLFLLIGCGGLPRSELSKIEPGIMRAEFTQKYGEPHGTSFVDNRWVLMYYTCDSAGMRDGRSYYFIFDKQDKLEGWQERLVDKQRSTTTGILVNWPMPK